MDGVDDEELMQHHHDMNHSKSVESSRRMNLFFYVGLGFIGLLLLTSLIVGAVSIQSRYRSLNTCVVSHPLTPYRLPLNIVKPLHYDIQLRPDLKTLNFGGTVKMSFEVKTDTRCVVFNAEDLKFEKTNIILLHVASASSVRKISVQSVEKDTEYNKVTLKLNELLRSGGYYELQIEYSAALRTEMRGFYQRSYVNANGETKYVAATQFESEDARYAFPCFDEPELKANFTVSILVTAHDAAFPKMKALTNMPESSRKVLGDGTVFYQFETSPLMSTYFTAFVVGEYDFIEAMEDELRIRVYLLPGTVETGRFQLDIACNVTRFLNNYFGIKFPLPKMDLIGIPDFRGAMENMGLLTFNPAILIVDNATTMIQAADNAEVVAHEVAHQWTGDLVTCKWWSDLWLNEGFATFFETFSLDAVRPQFNRWQTKLINSFQHAFVTDALPTSHAIVNSANSPAEVYAVFDKITYEKGGAILYMMYNAIGAEKFRLWMRSYFNKYQYSSAETSELFEVMKANNILSAHVDLVSAWAYKPGFPVVEVKQGASGSLRLEQSRFFSRQPKNETVENTIWWIPVTIKSSNGAVKRYDMTAASLEVAAGSSEWIKLNNNQTAFYRVNYPKNIWEELFKQIKNDNAHLSTSDRFGLVDDLFALSFSGHLKLADALRLIPAIEAEHSYVVWSTVLSYLDKIVSLIAHEPIYENFKRLVLDLIEEKYEELGWEVRASDTENDKQLRVSILSAATKYGMDKAVNAAVGLFYAMQNSSTTAATYDVKIRSTIYKTFVGHTGEKGYYQMLAKYIHAVNTADSSEITTCLYALAWTSQPSLLKNTLEFSLNKLVQTSQEAIYLIREVGNNPFGTLMAWEFVREYYDSLLQKVNKRVVAYYGLIPGITSRFATKTKYDEVKAFFDMTKGDSSTKVVHETLETILVNEYLLKANYVELKTFLETNFPFDERDD